MATFRVKRGGSVMSPQGKTVPGGSIITDNNNPFTLAQIELLIKCGAVEPVSNAAAPQDDEPVENPPGVGAVKPLPNMSDAFDSVIKSKEGGHIEKSETIRLKDKRKHGHTKQQQSLWIVDPKNIEDKDLDELNVMVAERDSNMEPFATVAEAKAQLTKDFND